MYKLPQEQCLQVLMYQVGTIRKRSIYLFGLWFLFFSPNKKPIPLLMSSYRYLHLVVFIKNWQHWKHFLTKCNVMVNKRHSVSGNTGPSLVIWPLQVSSNNFVTWKNVKIHSISWFLFLFFHFILFACEFVIIWRKFRVCRMLSNNANVSSFHLCGRLDLPRGHIS